MIRVTARHIASGEAIGWIKEALSREKWDCNICGGKVDLSNAKRPSVRIGPGNHPKRETTIEVK